MNTRASQTAPRPSPPKAPAPEAIPVLTGQPMPSPEAPAAASTSAAMLDSSLTAATAAFIEPERRRLMIAEAAYYLAERRGFEPGCELEDWCEAEGEIDARLTRGEVPGVRAVGEPT